MLPTSRILAQNDRPLAPDGSFVLYWMISARRSSFNFGLERAVELAAELRKPLVILEPLRAEYPFASDRFHTFVIDGMRANAAALKRSAATYYPYIEPAPGHGSGLLAALSRDAAAVVTDWFPAFFLPRMLASAARQCRVRLEAVDSNTLIPAAEHGRAFPTARGYRAFVQRSLRPHLGAFPAAAPLERMPAVRAQIRVEVLRRWPAADLSRTTGAIVRELPIDHSVARTAFTGGQDAARTKLREFIDHKLARYGDGQKHPDLDVTSRLSPYLHFGHMSVHELFSEIMTAERWTSRKLGAGRAGAREGWWGVSAGTEAFLDQITVWRELAFNGCRWTDGYGSYAALPAWARSTLESHRHDPRPHLYSLDQLDAADTSDDIWNAAQTELREEGWFHGYMRMLWGKKILEWCREPADALDRMEHLMNRYSLDGRDPVSLLNYAWVLGMHDRPWPERPVFGTVRSMTAASARRKLKLAAWLARYGPGRRGGARAVTSAARGRAARP